MTEEITRQLALPPDERPGKEGAVASVYFQPPDREHDGLELYIPPDFETSREDAGLSGIKQLRKLTDLTLSGEHTTHHWSSQAIPQPSDADLTARGREEGRRTGLKNSPLIG